MNFLEKMDFLMKKSGLNKNTLSNQSDVPYTTIDGWYKKGYSNAKLSTIQKIADFFDVTLDYLIRDDITDGHFGKTLGFEISIDEKELIKKYRNLDGHGKKAINITLDYELERTRAALDFKIPEKIASSKHQYTKPIPFPGKVSAGLGVEAIENYDTINGPDNADFALIVDGDSMEPLFQDGQIVYIKQTSHVENGQIAVVQVMEEDDFFPRAYLKKFKKSHDIVELISLNPTYEKMIVSAQDVEILGVVL